MTLVIPTKADRSTQAAFQEIEDRLWKLEQAVKNKTENTEAVDELREEMKRALAKPTHLDFTDVFRGGAAHALGYVPDPGYESSGMTKVLRSDGSWGQGLVQEVPWRYNAGNLSYAGTSSAQRVVNVFGSIAGVGALSAHSIRARRHHIKSVTAYMYNSASIDYTTGASLALTFDTVLYDTAGLVSTTARLAPPSDLPSGYWYIWAQVRWSSHVEGASPWHSLNLQRNSAGTYSDAKTLAVNTVRDGNGQVIDMEVSAIAHLTSADHVELFVSGGHNDTVTAVSFAQPTPGFGMIYLGA